MLHLYFFIFIVISYITEFLDEPVKQDDSSPDKVLYELICVESTLKSLEMHVSCIEKMVLLENFREKVIVGSSSVSDKQLRDRVNILSSLDIHCFELSGVLERLESLQESFGSSSSNFCQKLTTTFPSNKKITNFVKSEESYLDILNKTITAIKNLERWFRNISQWHLSKQPSTTQGEALEKTFRKVVADYRRSLNKATKMSPFIVRIIIEWGR